MQVKSIAELSLRSLFCLFLSGHFYTGFTVVRFVFLQELSTITGSRGFERFTGTQIMKISQTQKDAYENTEVRV